MLIEGKGIFIAKHLTYRGDKFYYDGVEMTDTQLEAKFDTSKEAANNVDMFLLLAIYSVILGEVQRMTSAMDTDSILSLIDDQRFLMFPVVIYMPEFMERLGLKKSINARNIQTLADKILSYNGSTDRIKCRRGLRNILGHSFPVSWLTSLPESGTMRLEDPPAPTPDYRVEPTGALTVLRTPDDGPEAPLPATENPDDGPTAAPVQEKSDDVPGIRLTYILPVLEIPYDGIEPDDEPMDHLAAPDGHYDGIEPDDEPVDHLASAARPAFP